MFDLPEDVVLGLPRLVLLGDLQVLIEHHEGLAEFGPERVVVHTAKGDVAVRGAHLTVGAVDRDTVVLTGQVRSVEFLGR